MMKIPVQNIESPFDDETVAGLKAGIPVVISGVIFTARDAAHRRIAEALAAGKGPPVELAGQTVYYMGPTPPRPGRVIGAAGPTTSGRLDIYTPGLLAYGVRATIGKGQRSPAVREALAKHRALYLAAPGGAGALLSRCIVSAEVVAYEDLGPEAVFRLVVKDFPAIVAGDIYGGDIYETGRAKYRTGSV